MGFEIVAIAILVFAVVTVWKGVRIVPQGEEWIVERLGKFNKTLSPGLTIKSVEIQDIKPSESMVKSMELQAAAERERKAVVTRAEGAKQAMILEAEGRLESAKRDAVAQVTLAESSAQAIQKVAHAVADRDTPMLYLLGEKYIHAVENLAASGNSKFVLLPADLQDALRGILGKARSV